MKGLTNASGGVLHGSIGTPELMDSAVTSAKIANGAVSRDKLATGALYSPMSYESTNNTVVLTNSYSGMTISFNRPSQNIVVSITKANSDAIPVGSEFALLFYNGNKLTVTFSGGLYVEAAGMANRALNASISVSEKYTLIALKKVASVEWLVTGNVEVVT